MSKRNTFGQRFSKVSGTDIYRCGKTLGRLGHSKTWNTGREKSAYRANTAHSVLSLTSRGSDLSVPVYNRERSLQSSTFHTFIKPSAQKISFILKKKKKKIIISLKKKILQKSLSFWKKDLKAIFYFHQVSFVFDCVSLTLIDADFKRSLTVF